MKKLYNLSIKIYTQKELLRHCIFNYSQKQTATCRTFTQMFPHTTKASNHSGNDFRHARKCQTIREITFAMRGNSKPFEKQLSPCAETPNYSGNDSRHARKHQTIRETSFAMRGNIKPFGKRLSTMRGNAKLFGKGVAGGPQIILFSPDRRNQ